MNVSNWLDRQTEEKGDISQIELPVDLTYDVEPDEMVFFEEINRVEFFAIKTIRFRVLSAMVIGTIVLDRTRVRGLILQK